ncbi:FKBP-type peptidyl-prolyl cis-trans isomerase [Candidatus Woesearchaeota archaeon]|nr:FKBP-type peptidyl-prolyl cis-trans isomerase [Candidatus Woesearchaeota archaeon]
MPLKEHDFVELDYTGFLKENNDVFDTTDAKTAKEHHLQGATGKLTICLGKGHLLRGLEQKLIGKELGKHRIELTQEEAFGRKNAKLIHLIPTQNFIKSGVQPQPGLPVEVDGMMGTIRTVTGGRTIVDFNHPLSGRDVTYDVTLHRVVTDAKDKVAAMVKALIGQEGQVSMTDDDAAVKLKDELPKQVADELSKEIVSATGVKQVTFSKA